MSGRYGDLDYHRLTKSGVAFGVGLFVVGALCQFASRAVLGGLAGWPSTFLADIELLGVAIAFSAPILFGIVLPLTE